MPRFFGQYLLEKELINHEQLLKALQHQRTKVRKLGEIAIKKGYLKESEVKAIHQEQRTTDMMFGELAVMKGFLTEEQVKELINIQRSSHIYIGEAFAELGILSSDIIEEELKHFNEEERDGLTIEVQVPEEVRPRELLKITGELSIKIFRRIANLLVKSSYIKHEHFYTVNSFLSLMIELRGGFDGKILLKLSHDVANRIALAMTDYAPSLELDMIQDACGEFLNILCGQIITKYVMETGKSVKISVPRGFHIGERSVIVFEPGERAVIFPLFTQEGFAELQVIGEFREEAPHARS